MKTIVLLPVKNESWILRYSLKNFSEFADHIIIADQHSTDNSLSIYKEFPKITVIQNDEIEHGNKVRWRLLEEARKLGDKNLIICVDADEMISPKVVGLIKSMVVNAISPIAFRLPWIQLWKGIDVHRVDGVWKDNRKDAAFLDDPSIDYERRLVLNDHTGRIPRISNTIDIDEYPLIHFQYAAWERTEIKQSWYRCSELINGEDPRKINLKYSITMDNTSVRTAIVPKKWLQDIPVPELSPIPVSEIWQYKDIIKWFNEKGIEFFEPLQIWHVKELYDLFLKQTGRKPVSKTFPSFIVMLNNIKNRLKGLFSNK